MSKRNTRVYDSEFTHNAVNLYNEGGKSHKELAEDLGIPPSLAGWVQEREKSGDNAFPKKGYQKPDDARMKFLERENERLKHERDILKNALAIFSLP